MTAVEADSLLGILGGAADLIMRVYRGQFAVEYKAPGDPVTVADRLANDWICRQLTARYPGLPIVAEESDASQYAHYRAHSAVFFVDPLDGTREFVRRNGEFVTMIGLLQGERPTVGAILQPTTGEAAIGVVGRGAWWVAPGGQRTAIRVSTADSLAATRLVASRAGDERRYAALRRRLGLRAIAPLGSAGMKGLAIARGAAEGYVAPERGGQRWDSCAVEALVTAAGGRCTDGFGRPLDYRCATLANDRGLVVSNGGVHELLLDLLERRRQGQLEEKSPT